MSLPTGTVTFLLTDIEGSSLLWEQHPEEMERALARHDAMIAAEVEQHNGILIKSKGEGDSTFAVFARAKDAVAAAYSIQRAFITEPWSPHTRLRVRMGLYTGEAELQEGDYRGTAVNRCARLRNIAQGGQIVLSLTTAELVRDALPKGASLKDLGVHPLKGLQRPEHVFQLIYPISSPDFAPPGPSGTPPSNLPYPPNPHFVGREKICTELHEVLSSPEHPFVALVGLGGLGKTQLAIEYAHAHLGDYPGGVFWIHAENSLRVKDDYAALGRFFDLPEDLPIQERAARVREALQQLDQPALLIFDNLMEKTDLALLPSFGQCRVLVTTREGWLVRQGFRTFNLSLLEEEASLRLLQTHREAKSEEELSAAREIAARLGYLPLALSLVAHQVGRLGTSFSDYLERLRNPDELVKALEQARRRFITTTGHTSSLFDTIALSYQSLDPSTQLLLAIASCFAGRDISQNLLLEAARFTREEYEESLTNLVDYSLITFEEDDSLTLHELVRAFVLWQLPDPDQRALVERVAALLTHRLMGANQTLDWKRARREIAHCQSAAELCRADGLESVLYPLLHEMGVYFFKHGDFRAAEECFAEGLSIVERLFGKTHRDRARFLRSIGEAKHEQHDYTGALPHVQESLALATATLDPNDPQIADFISAWVRCSKNRAIH